MRYQLQRASHIAMLCLVGGVILLSPQCADRFPATNLEDEGSGTIVNILVREIVVPPGMIAFAREIKSKTIQDHDALCLELEKAGLNEAWYFLVVDSEQMNGKVSRVGWLRYPRKSPDEFAEVISTLDTLANHSPDSWSIRFSDARIIEVPEHLRRLDPLKAVHAMNEVEHWFKTP